MNSFTITTTLALCLVAQCALAQYGQQQQQHYQPQQRKMAPTPQIGAYQARPQPAYEPAQQQQSSYGAQQESSAYPVAASSYSQRSSSGYAKQQQPSYSNSQAASYPPTSASYSAKPKYEEPYHPPMPFAWGYDINDGYGGAQYHKESGDEYGKRTGSYGYTDAYGVYRQVDYVADEHGFRATVKTNEPGTANEAPADVEWHAYEPPSNYYAGNTNSYSGQSNSYAAASAPVAAPAASYSASASASKQPQYQAGASSYPQASRASNYGAPSHSARPQYSQAQSQPQRYQQSRSYTDQASQYSGSQLVPVYQKPSNAQRRY